MNTNLWTCENAKITQLNRVLQNCWVTSTQVPPRTQKLTKFQIQTIQETTMFYSIFCYDEKERNRWTSLIQTKIIEQMKKNTVLHLEFYTVRSLVVIKRRLRSSGRSHIKTRSATISSDMTWSATILSKDSFASQIFLIFTQIRFLIHRKKLSPPCMAGLVLDNCTFDNNYWKCLLFTIF